MTDYWCANCGERSSMMGHWRSPEKGFTCTLKPKDEPMAEISEAAKSKALELAKLQGVGRGTGETDGRYYTDMLRGFASYIEQVSDAVKEVDDHLGKVARERLAFFILPEPVALDVLAVRKILHAQQRAMAPPDSGWGNMSYERGSYDDLPTFKAALAAYRELKEPEA